MRIRTQCVLLVLGAAALAVLCGCQRYVDYVPLVAVDDGTEWRFEPRPELLSDAHVAAMIEQLVRYNMPYRMRDGRLQIGADLAKDQDLVRNLVAKAIAEQEARSGG